MSQLSKRFLSVLLSLIMVLSLSVTGYAAPEDEKAAPAGTIFETEEADPSLLNVPRLGLVDEIPNGEELPPYGLNDIVRVSIELEKPATIEQGYSVQNIAQNPDAVSYRNALRANQDAVAAAISNQVLGGAPLDVVWNITLLGNVISANVPYGKIDAIRKVEGVVAVGLETQYAPAAVESDEAAHPNMVSARDMTGTSTPEATEYNGAGQRLAVIDTGLDDEHQSFDPEAFMHAIEEDKAEDLLLTADQVAEVWSQLNFAKRAQNASLTPENAYLNAKVPYHANYVDNSFITNHTNDTQEEHGSHVAGITSANRYLKKGEEFVDAATEVGVIGQAPDAQILVMKVFGAGGGAYDSDYMVAIEDALILGADSVNLSLGSSAPGVTAITNTTYQNIYRNLVNKDLTVVISMGNNTSWDSQKALYSDDVNFDTGGSPGSYTNSLTVASIDDSGKYAPFLKFNDSLELRYMDGGGAANNAPFVTIAGNYEYVYIDGPGVDDNTHVGQAGDQFLALGEDVVKGKIALCNRGTSSFFAKANAAVAQGAVGVIIVNNQAGTISMALDGYLYTNPVASIKQAEGAVIKDASAAHEADGFTYYTGTIEVGGSDNKTPMEYYEMSSFSSWGVPDALILKPEITAPGGSVYSLNGYHRAATGGGYAGGHDAYELMSGTSMAAPQITGIAAVIGEYYRKANIAERTGLSRRTFVQSIIMSTADPVMEEASKNYYALMKQGAGLANTGAAVSSDSYILMDEEANSGAADGKVKVELGDDPERAGVYTYGFTLYNIGEDAHEYKLSTDLFTQAVVKNNGIDNLDHTTVSIEGEDSYEWVIVPNADVNKDGHTDNFDVQAILETVVDSYEGEFNEAVADVDGDGKITSYDANLLVKALGGEAGSGDTLTLPAGSNAHVVATITLPDSTKAELDAPERKGAYVEGFTFIKSEDDSTHSIPILGYYGSWTDPTMYDRNNYTDRLYGSNKTSYWNGTNTNDLYIQNPDAKAAAAFAGNPYVVEEEFPADRLAINGNANIASVRYSLIRRGAGVAFVAADPDGEILYRSGITNGVANAYFNTQASNPSWQQTTARTFNVNRTPASFGLEEGDKFNASLVALPDYYALMANGDINKNTFTSADDFDNVLASGIVGDGAKFGYTLTIDNTAPEFAKENAVVLNEDGSITVTVSDNSHIAYMALFDVSGKVVLAEAAAPGNEPGAEYSHKFVIPEGVDVGKAVYAFVGDYAGNETAIIARVAEGEITVEKSYYVLTDALEDGKEYLIANANAEGNAVILSHSGTTKGTVAVTIKAADDENPAMIETDDLEDFVFAASALDTGFRLKSGDYYLTATRNNVTFTGNAPAATQYFTYDAENSRLGYRNGNNTYYVRYANNQFTGGTTQGSVYLFERKTKVVPFDPDAVEKIIVTPENVQLYAGGTEDFSAEVLPRTLDDKNVTWSVSDEEIATIDPESGHLVAVAPGTVEVIATAAKDNKTTGSVTVTVRDRVALNATVNAQISDAAGPRFVKIDLNDLSLETLGEAAAVHYGGGRSDQYIVGFASNGDVVVTEIDDEGYYSEVLGSFGTTAYNSKDGAHIPVLSAEVDGEVISEEYHSIYFASNYLLLFDVAGSITGWNYNNGSALTYVGADEGSYYYYSLTNSGQLLMMMLYVNEEEPVTDGELNVMLATAEEAENVEGLAFSQNAMSMSIVETDEVIGLLIANNDTKEIFFVDLMVEEGETLKAVSVGGYPKVSALTTLYNDDYDTDEPSALRMAEIQKMAASIEASGNEPLKAKELAKTEVAVGTLNAIKAEPAVGEDDSVCIDITDDEDASNGYVAIAAEDAELISVDSEVKNLAYNIDEEGVIRIAYANGDPIPAGESIAKVVLDVKPAFGDKIVNVCAIERNDEFELEEAEEVNFGLELDKDEVTVKSDADEKLTVKFIGSDVEYTNVEWASSDEAIVTVDETGKLTPVKAGKAVITATVNETEASADVLVLFDDVQNSGRFYYEPVYWALENGITTGVADFRFAPNETCTREQIVTFLWRLKGEPKPEKDFGFSDVKAGKWYSDAVNWAAGEGITTGYGGKENKFGIGDKCTREQVVTFLHRAAGSPEPEKESEFKDVKSGAYYAKAVAWAAEKNITQGVDAEHFGVGESCTRGQIVTFLYRFANLEVEPVEEPGE